MKFFLSLIFLLAAFNAGAFQNEQHLNNPAQEERAQALFKNIRCMVCTGESLAESNADLAVGMRKLVREKISARESDEEIKSYFTTRYGPQILQTPPFVVKTYFLWLTPLLIFCFGALFILKFTQLKGVFKR